MDNRAGNESDFDLFTGLESNSGSRVAEQLVMPDAEVFFHRAFFSKAQSDVFYQDLEENTNWKQETIKFYGKLIDLPRLTAWYGDEGKSYTYSGIKVNPNPWTPTLMAIKQQIEIVSDVAFNSVLLNFYRNERDGVAWHSDDEPELGSNPVIGSVSFGETRTFQFRHKHNKDLRVKIDLPHGSYLLMKGATQHVWLHQIPKTTRPRLPRINLTFRVIK